MGIITRHYIASACTDRIGWFNHLDKPFFRKLPRRLKKLAKKMANADRVEFGKGPLPTARVRVKEFWYSLTWKNWRVDYKSV